MGVPRRFYLVAYPMLAALLGWLAVAAHRYAMLRGWHLDVVMGIGATWFLACTVRAIQLYPRYRELIKLQAKIWKAARPLWLHRVRYYKDKHTIFYASFSSKRTKLYLWCVNWDQLLQATKHAQEDPTGADRFYVPCICYRLRLFNGEILRHETEIGFSHNTHTNQYSIFPHRIHPKQWLRYRTLLLADQTELITRLTALEQWLCASKQIGGKHQFKIPL